MKKILLLIFLGLNSLVASSQKAMKNVLAFRAGPAFALGAFHQSQLNDNRSGFGKTGEAVTLEWEHEVERGWDLLVLASGQRNPLNKAAFENILDRSPLYLGVYAIGDLNNPPQVTGTIYPNWNVKRSSWLCASLQAGLQRRFLAAGRLGQFSLGLSAGVAFVRSATVSGSSITDTVKVYLQQNRVSGTGLAFSTRAGWQLPLGKRGFVVKAGLVYASTSAITFRNVKGVITAQRGNIGDPNFSLFQYTSTSDGKQTLQALQVLAGVGVRF